MSLYSNYNFANNLAAGRVRSPFPTKGSGRLSHASDFATHALDKLEDAFFGLAGKIDIQSMAKKQGDRQQQLVELSSRYNMSADELKQLDDRAYEIAIIYKMPYTDVIGAVDALLEQTNDFNSTINNIDNLGLATRGLGFSAVTAGSDIGQLINRGLTPEAINNVLGGVASASRIGSGNLNAQFSELVNLTSGSQWQSADQLMQLLAIRRLSQGSLGNHSGAAIEALTHLQTGEGQLIKDPADLILSLSEKLKNGQSGQSNLAHSSKQDANLDQLINLFSDEKKAAALTNGITADNELLMTKSQQNSNTINGAVSSLSNAKDRYIQRVMSTTVDGVVNTINNLTPEELADGSFILGGAAGVVGGGLLARKLFGNQSGNQFSTGGFGMGSEGILPSSSGVVPVYVTNWGGFGYDDIGLPDVYDSPSKGNKQTRTPKRLPAPASKGSKIANILSKIRLPKSLDFLNKIKLPKSLDFLNKIKIPKSLDFLSKIKLPKVSDLLDKLKLPKVSDLLSKIKSSKALNSLVKETIPKTLGFLSKRVLPIISSGLKILKYPVMGARIFGPLGTVASIGAGFAIDGLIDYLDKSSQSDPINEAVKPDALYIPEYSRVNSQLLNKRTSEYKNRERQFEILDEVERRDSGFSTGLNSVTGSYDERFAYNGGRSEIVLTVESAKNLEVRTKSISASDTDIVVNTGNTYSSFY